MENKKVLEPINIGRMQLRNRVIFPAMAKYFCTNGYIGREYVEYYRTIARGGAALVIPGIMIVDPEWYSQKLQPFLNDDKYIPGMRAAVDAVHAEGAKMAFQPWIPAHLPYTAEDLPEVNGRKIACVNLLSRKEIADVQQKYLKAVERCVKAGVDAIEVHAAHNYLPEQFFSPYFNQRRDEYGCDTIENAMRFTTELIGRARAAFGDKVEFIAKINCSDFHPGSITPEWLVAGCRELEKSGISLVTVSGGGVISRLTGMSSDGNEEEGWKVPFAELVKKNVKIPVAAIDGIRRPAYVEQILAEGKCDLVAMGRGLLAEPEWVKKVAAGQEDELRYCISCMHCLTMAPLTEPGCSVNPRGRREFMIPAELNANGNGAKVVVVGAGPAGLEAAVTLAKRGFKPIICEQSAEIGGMVLLAAEPLGKQKLKWMIEYYRQMIDKLNIDLRLNTCAEKDSIKAEDPWAIIIATGSREFIPRIPGLDCDKVIQVRDFLKNKPQIKGKDVLILGAGLTGLETARMLAAENKVTILDMLEKISLAATEQRLALRYAEAAGVKIFTGHAVCEITALGVKARDLLTGEVKEFPAEAVISSFGATPEKALFEALKDMPNVYCIGDSGNCAKIAHAVSDGYLTAANLPAPPYEIRNIHFAQGIY